MKRHFNWITFLNISGLAVGLAASMFLLLHLNFEFSFDRHFQDADRIYRVLSVWEEGGKPERYPINLRSLREALKAEVPEVEEVVQMYDMRETVIPVGEGENKKEFTRHVMVVDSTFFSVFPFATVSGDAAATLAVPGKCVLTKSTAEAFFGPEIDPIGQTFLGSTVGAVIEDVPENTHFNFDILIFSGRMFSHQSLEYHTYVKFRQGANLEESVKKCNAVNEKLLGARFQMANIKFSSMMEPLPQLHTASVAKFNIVPAADKGNLYFIIAVVLFVLGIAITNFIALTLIRGEKRATEISIRKTNGAHRQKLIQMLFGETLTTTCVAFFLAIIIFTTCATPLANLLQIALPSQTEGWLGRLAGLSAQMWWNFALLLMITATMAGIYPAFYLSRFSPMDLMRSTSKRKHRLTAASVVLQFSAVVFCLSAVLVVTKQLQFAKNLPLGYNPDNVLVADASIRTEQYESIRSELMESPVITAVSISQGVPGSGHSGQMIRREAQNDKESMGADERRTGRGYFETYCIPIVQGRDFTGNPASDTTAIIISETTAKDLGLDNPIGQKLVMFDFPMEVVGVAKDIHSSSVRNTIERLVYTAYNQGNYSLSVRFTPGTERQAREVLATFLKKRFPQRTIEIELIKDQVQKEYREDEITVKILMSGSVLAILLSLFGLLALSGFAAQQRTKEIGLRRVMGSSILEVVWELIRYILVRILPALPIGICAAWIVMRSWLSNFAYAANMGWLIFAAAAAGTLLIALLTVLLQSYRAATANPVDAIKANE